MIFNPGYAQIHLIYLYYIYIIPSHPSGIECVCFVVREWRVVLCVNGVLARVGGAVYLCGISLATPVENTRLKGRLIKASIVRRNTVGRLLYVFFKYMVCSHGCLHIWYMLVSRGGKRKREIERLVRACFFFLSFFSSFYYYSILRMRRTQCVR